MEQHLTKAAAGPAPGGIEGYVDGADAGRIRGWAVDRRRPFERLRVAVYAGGQCLLTATADRFRQDLLELRYGDGHHGFEADIPAEVFATPLLQVQVRFVEGGEELKGSPVEVKAGRLLLNPPTMAMLGEAVAAVAKAAGTAEALDTLRVWLMRQHDLVYKRQSVLIRTAIHRDVVFAEHLNVQQTLANVLQNAAKTTALNYDAVHLDPALDPAVSVIIPAFNHFAYTHRCAQSIVEHLPSASFEVVIVDDGSTDETIYAGSVLLGGFRLVRNARNTGFLGAVKAGIAVARGRYLMFLNNDTEVQAGWLDALLATFARDPAIGVAGSKLIYPDGRLQEAGAIIWRQATGLNWGRLADPDDPRYCFMRDADYVSGAALMVERAVFDAVGGLSEAFDPGYYEDTDLCFKVRQAGRRVVVQPRSRVTHHEGVSAGTDLMGQQMKRFQRVNHRTFLTKWFDTLQGHGLSGGDAQQEADRLVTKRALFVDDSVPTPDQDAGSNVALQYMLSLQRLGYKVSFVGAHNIAKISPYTEELEALGIQCCYRPYTQTVEEIVNAPDAGFDVFFVHRPANMAKYAGAIRARFPNAPIIYCVADLHHLRLEREAELYGDQSRRVPANEMRKTELAMVAKADSVIVHSSYEAGYLREQRPSARIHVIPWTVDAQAGTADFQSRSGLAFIGGFNHPPNVDAATWLVNEILPLVWAQAPDIECMLIGSHMPANIRALRQARVHIVGFLPDLGPTLRHLRLTAAPLRYGAGLKGKVLTSLAAGLPCVATPCAVEGMDLPASLDVMVASTPDEFAAKILLAYQDEGLNTALGEAGVDYIKQTCAPERIDALLSAAIPRAGQDHHPGAAEVARPAALPRPKKPRKTRRSEALASQGELKA